MPKCARRPPRALGDVELAKARADALMKMLGDSEPRAQFFAAQSLGKLGKDAIGAGAVARAAARQ